MSFSFSCWNRDALPCIGICGDKVLISISEVFSNAFREGIERVACQGTSKKSSIYIVSVRGHRWHICQ
jgi:hypothetical protein